MKINCDPRTDGWITGEEKQNIMRFSEEQPDRMTAVEKQHSAEEIPRGVAGNQEFVMSWI